MRRLGILFVAILLLAGCETFPAHKYSLSVNNINAIKDTMGTGHARSLAVRDFTAASPGEYEIHCGINGLITMPRRTPVEKYIREALIDELKEADVYSLDQIEATGVITGHLKKLKIHPTGGGWLIDLTITFKSGEAFTVSESYPLNGAQCDQTAAALAPAVQDLIHQIIAHPAFQKKMGMPTN